MTDVLMGSTLAFVGLAATLMALELALRVALGLAAPFISRWANEDANGSEPSERMAIVGIPVMRSFAAAGW